VEMLRSVVGFYIVRTWLVPCRNRERRLLGRGVLDGLVY
jgi:hypothetical protein